MAKPRLLKKHKEQIQASLKEMGLPDDLKSHEILHTDPSCHQVAISLGDDTWLYSQRDVKDELANQWSTRTEVGDFSCYTAEELEHMVSAYAESLDAFKEQYGENWKRTALECGFEQELL